MLNIQIPFLASHKYSYDIGYPHALMPHALIPLSNSMKCSDDANRCKSKCLVVPEGMILRAPLLFLLAHQSQLYNHIADESKPNDESQS